MMLRLWFHISGLLGVLCFSMGASSCSRGSEWARIEQVIARRFPTVRQISPDKLKAWLEDPTRPAPLLLDVRTAAEFSVSHLNGARQVDPSADPAKALADVPKNNPIVTYCSVGWRSSAFADRLQRTGFTNVQQLDGSIFQWANLGHPVYRDGRPVHEVHPFNRRWGELLTHLPQFGKSGYAG